MQFYKRMALVCARIPYGRATSYGQIALLCGKPKNARQVGYGLRKGLAGEHIPAYRVVNSRGILSGAASFETPELQRMLLEEEGIRLTRTEEGWRVDLKQFGWKPTLEEAEELYTVYREQNI